MPKRNVRDVVHASYTDHRIQRPGSSVINGGELLRPWRVNPKHQDRSSALASFEWGVLNHDVSAIQEAFRKLIHLEPAGRNDPVVLSALGAIAMQKNRPREAAEWLRKAASMDARNPKHSSGWGVRKKRMDV